MSFGQVLAGGALSLDQIRYGVQAEAIDSQIQPELHDLPHLLADGGIVVIQIGLMAEEAMPVVGLGDGVPGPVGHLGVEKDDSCATVTRVGVAPDVPIAPRIVA